MTAKWKKWINYFLHFWFPRTCVSCARDLPSQSTGFLCEDCFKSLKEPGPLICQRCGVSLPSGGAHCYACRGSKKKQYKCKIIRSTWVFNMSSRALIHALKYDGADYMAAGMGEQMARHFSRYPELANVEIVTAVPLHPSKQRARGYNQSELLGQSFARHTGLAWEPALLKRARNTKSQTKLNRAERLANMTGAFSCVAPEQVRGKTILLIDDVATTGSTLEGCAIALKTAGAKRVFAYTYAREN